MKLPRWALRAFALIAWAYVAPLACPELMGQTVALDQVVAAFLHGVSKDSVEHVICLYGHTVPDTIYLERYSIPAQRAVGTHNVSADASDCQTALAHFHNHPVPKDSTAGDYFYYSLSDEHAFIETTNAPLAVVGTPAGWCMWSRYQVWIGRQMNLTPLPPVPKQCMAWP